MILVTLRKGNHPVEAYMRRDRRKELYKRERGTPLEGPYKEAEIECKALRRRKNLAFNKDSMFRKGKSAVEGDPKKSWSRIVTEAGVE